MRVVNLAPYATPMAPKSPYSNVVTLKPNTVYDYQAADGTEDWVVVQCPPAKKGKIEKAFTSYVSISTGDDDTNLEVVDAKTGVDLGMIWAVPEVATGSMLTILCVNGRITAAYNEASVSVQVGSGCGCGARRLVEYKQRWRKGKGARGAMPVAVVACDCLRIMCVSMFGLSIFWLR